MKRITAVIIIVLILILGDRAGAYIISSLFVFSNYQIARLYSNNITEKIVILGNSRAFRHFDYKFMEKKFSHKIINLSEPGQAALTSEVLLKDFTDLNGIPKLVIIEATSTLNDFESVLTLRPFQSKSPRVEQLIKNNHYSIFFWSKISHLYRLNNETTINIFHKIFTKSEPEILEGTILNNTQFKTSPLILHDTDNEIRYTTEYFSQNLKALKEIIKYCNKNKINLRILISPIFPNNPYIQNEVHAIKLNLQEQYIWDFSKINNLDYEDFYDSGHLNKNGVKKFMSALEEKKFF